MLEKLRGKRMLFVGDSLQMGQWLSFVCLVNSVLHYTARTMERSTTLSVFTATVSLSPRRARPTTDDAACDLLNSFIFSKKKSS